MSRVVRCQGRVKRNGRTVVCGESVLYARPDGETVSVLVYDPVNGVEIGPCCAKKNRKRWEDLLVNFLGFPDGYVAVPDEPTEEDLGRQRWFRHALAWEPPRKVGGLIRAVSYDDPMR